MPDASIALAEHLFRDRWRDVIAALVNRFGAARLEQIEDAVQQAFLKALDRWSLEGPPANPGGWIYRVAVNSLLDQLRREGRFPSEAVVEDLIDDRHEEPLWFGPLADEVMRMILVCAHPSLRPRESLAITLRLVCGLGLHEIASALLLSDEAAHKLLARSKAKLREAAPSLEPSRLELDWESEAGSRRLLRILQLIYLLFNEGYSAHTGAQLVRLDLTREAERLLLLLLESEAAKDSRLWALAALISFQASRLPARSGPEGHLLRLSEQDRAAWDRRKVAQGFACLDRAIGGSLCSRYHLEAAIAACHAGAASYEETDWVQILSLYDQLLEIWPTAVVRLNRAVALAMVEGAAAGLAALAPLCDERTLANTYLLPAVRADLLSQAGRKQEAIVAYERASALARNEAVCEFLLARRAALQRN